MKHCWYCRKYGRVQDEVEIIDARNDRICGRCNRIEEERDDEYCISVDIVQDHDAVSVIVQMAMDKYESLKVSKSTHGKVACQNCLSAFSARYPNADISTLSKLRLQKLG